VEDPFDLSRRSSALPERNRHTADEIPGDDDKGLPT
jgi:hypothetical protein